MKREHQKVLNSTEREGGKDQRKGEPQGGKKNSMELGAWGGEGRSVGVGGEGGKLMGVGARERGILQ